MNFRTAVVDSRGRGSASYLRRPSNVRYGPVDYPARRASIAAQLANRMRVTRKRKFKAMVRGRGGPYTGPRNRYI